MRHRGFHAIGQAACHYHGIGRAAHTCSCDWQSAHTRFERSHAQAWGLAPLQWCGRHMCARELVCASGCTRTCGRVRRTPLCARPRARAARLCSHEIRAHWKTCAGPAMATTPRRHSARAHRLAARRGRRPHACVRAHVCAHSHENTIIGVRTHYESSTWCDQPTRAQTRVCVRARAHV